MENPERTGHILHQPEGDIAVKITEQTPDFTKAEVKFSTPKANTPAGFKAVLDLVDAEAPKKKTKLMVLADTIRNLGRPKMSEEGEKKVEAQIEEEMDKETEEGRKFWK